MQKSFMLIVSLLLNLTLSAQNNYNAQFRSHTEFPGQTLANICGYAKDGKEYALLGASKGLIIMDVTNPDEPKQIVQIPGPDNLWKEIKVYQHYAYVTSEGGQGLQIVDMTNLPAANLQSKFYTGDGDLAGKLNPIHALHIDVPKGVVYCFGANGSLSSGAIMLDIKTDPWNPKYLGVVNKDYIHDGYAENDTLYAGHIYRGEMEVWYTKDKKNPVSLGKVKTPTAFTHNIWLSDNHKYAFTTDENANSFLGAYDLTDLSDIKLVDKISHNIGSGAVVHNTHILNDYAISSYYTEGVTIHDVHRPDNLVEVAHYDTYAPATNPNDPFSGAWGVYPFLPSGNLIISNIDEGLYIVSPTYKRACYLEGKVLNSLSKATIDGATLKVIGVSTANAVSNLQGIYKTGVANEGSITVEVAKVGFKPKTVIASVTHGNVTNLDIELEPLSAATITVQVNDAAGNPIKEAKVSIKSASQLLSAKTNSDGLVTLTTFRDTVTVYAGKWGYSIALAAKQPIISSLTPTKLTLTKGLRDDFVSGLKHDWVITGDATTGQWVLDVPIENTQGGAKATPAKDNASDVGNECYLTGNLNDAPAVSDVDNGFVMLTSPSMDLTNFQNPTLSYDEWFYNGGGDGNMNDSIKVILNNGQAQKVIHITRGLIWNKWTKITLPLKGLLPLTNTMTVSFRTADSNPGHLVKAAIDAFELYEGTVGASDLIDEKIKIAAAPNPTTSSFSVTYDIPSPFGEMILSNAQGQVLEKNALSSTTGNMLIGENLAAGIYFLQIQSGEKMSRPMRLVKMN